MVEVSDIQTHNIMYLFQWMFYSFCCSGGFPLYTVEPLYYGHFGNNHSRFMAILLLLGDIKVKVGVGGGVGCRLEVEVG